MSKTNKNKNKVSRASQKELHRATAKKLPLDKISFFREHSLPLLIISILAFGLYFQSVRFDYVLDDKIVIADNTFTQKGINGIGDIFSNESFRGYFKEKKDLLEGGRYRPLSIATFAAEKSFFGSGNKAISHLINVLLYALTGILLYRVLLFMFPVTDAGKRKWFLTVPFIASILFIAHPLHVEVVANIKGRDEILAMLGEAGTLYFTFRYLSEKKSRYLFFSFLAFLSAILSKEGALTFLAVIPLTAHFFSTATTGQKVRITIPVLAGTIIYLFMRMNAIGYLLDNKEVTDLMNNPFFGMSSGEKTATIFYTLLLYLKLLIFPHPLTHDYYPYHIPVMNWSDWQSILSLLLNAGLVVMIVKGWKNKSVWAYASAFYLITLSIVSNVVISVGTFMNERFVYPGSLGFCIAMAWLLAMLLKKTKLLSLAALVCFFVMAAGFSIRTLIREPDWRSDLALDRSALRYSPNSSRANCFYAISIWGNVYKKLPKDADSARKHAVLDSINPYLEKSVKILPGNRAAQSMRAAIASEYFKLNNNYGDLLRIFEETNRSGMYEKYVTEFLQYMNGLVLKKTDAEKMSAFYSRMIDYYTKSFPGTPLIGDYKKLQEAVRQKMLILN